MSYAPPPPAKSGTSSAAVVIIVVLVSSMIFGMCLCVPLGIALLLPAVQTARDSARRMQSSNNAKQIGLAIQSYALSHGKLPPQFTVDPQGQPLHSWRTLLLPFVEQQNLFDQIDQNVAWDDPANAGVTSIDLQIFRSPRYTDLPGMTNYVAIAGEGCTFHGAEARSFDDIRDGTANTMLLIEIANSQIGWAEPRDLEIDALQLEADGAAADTPNLIRSVAVCGLLDGSVHVLTAPTVENLRALSTIAGSEAVSIP